MAEQDQEDPSDGEQDTPDAEGLTGVRRPMNAFFIFCKHHREIVKERYPHLENRSITKILGEWWAHIEPPEKVAYITLAKEYKEAFLKAHPDFKWYKLPTPPARTLVTRPTNSRQDEKNDQNSSNCAINLGKFADDEQLGGLSSLINPVLPVKSSTMPSSVISDVPEDLSMSRRLPETILKPPKKRYLINGEFRCQNENNETTVESRDDRTKYACSALLELAEACTNTLKSEGVLNEPSANHSRFSNGTVTSETNGDISSSTIYITAVTAIDEFSLDSPEEPIYSVPGSLAYPAIYTTQYFNGSTNTLPIYMTAAINSNCTLSRNPENQKTEQDQPLNLTLRKTKMKIRKTQRLTQHLINRFFYRSLQNGHHKSNLDDETITILVDTGRDDDENSCSNCDEIICKGITLSDAIESAVVRALTISWERDASVEKSELPVNSEGSFYELKGNVHAGVDKSNLSIIGEVDHRESLKNGVSPFCDNKSTSIFRGNDEGKRYTSKHENTSNTNGTVFKSIPPPKNPSMWFENNMNEQLEKDVSKDIKYKDLSKTRKNSQRACKGRRYKALVVEGVLPSTKERNMNVTRKPMPSAEKMRSKVESNENLTNSKKRKRRNDEKAEILFSEFNLEKRILALPKFDLPDHLNKKKKVLETPFESCDSQNSASSNYVNSGRSSNNLTPQIKGPPNLTPISNGSSKPNVQSKRSSSTSRNEICKTRDFDLELQLASLPNCGLEFLNRKRRSAQLV